MKASIIYKEISSTSPLSKAFVLIESLYHRDELTAKHSMDVACLTKAFASECLQTFSIDTNELFIGGLLHDIGKIRMPDIIFKNQVISHPEEIKIIRQHSTYSRNILMRLGFSENITNIAYLHHERYDGSGYPLGLFGQAIPIEAKILGITDSFSAMTEDRAYRKGMSYQEALSIIGSRERVLFDSQLVDLFIKNLCLIQEKASKYKNELLTSHK